MSAPNAPRWAARLASLDANLLVALDALLQESSVTRAAARMGVTQSAMSQTLARLRRQFDDPILVRVGRVMQPTPFAARVRARLRAAVGELEAVVRDRPDFDPASAEQRFVVATVDYLAMVLLPPLQRAVAEVAPAVDLAVHALDAGSITGRLEEGAIDLYHGVRGDTERALAGALLFREAFVVVARPDHPLLADEATPEAYARWPHVHVSPRRERGSIVDRALARAGLGRRVAVEVPYFGLVPGLLAGSDLVATVPERLGRRLAADHGLAVAPAPLPLAPIDIWMAWHPAFDGDPGLTWLRGVVEDVARAV